MKKRLLSLTLIAALCLSLLPVGAATALAEGKPAKLVVGGTSVIDGGYWTTDASTGELSSDDASETHYNVHYAKDSNTLTLNNATISGSGNNNSLTDNFNAAIYAAAARDQSVSLTIVLKDKNTVEAPIGIFVNSTGSGTATLTITSHNDGTLEASYSDKGIWVNSNYGNASLNIRNATVTAEYTNNIYGYGIDLRAGGNAKASLTVIGGQLTATGNGGAGIRYTFGGGTSGPGAPSLTVSGNAIVKANHSNGGGIVTNSSMTNTVRPTPGGENGGIVFDKGTGTVYGNVTLPSDLTIGKGESLNISNGASLTIDSGVTLTNEGTVTNSGTLTNNGTIDNYGTLSGTIAGTGKVNHIPTYKFNYPSTLTLTENNTGFYTASGVLSLDDSPVLPGNGNVVVYGTNKTDFNTLTLSKEGDTTQIIPFTINGVSKSNPYNAYLDKNQTRVFAVLDDKTEKDDYTIEVSCDGSDMKKVLSGTYTGTFNLYVGYTTDENVKFDDVVEDVDLNQLTRYTVTVTLENTLGLGITTQPSDVTVGEGNAATFNVAASGGGTLTYQWQQSIDGGSNWTNITGATNATYTIDRTTTDMSGNQYRCVVKDGYDNSVTSNAAALTVTEQPRYQIAVDPAALDFGSIDDDQAAPAAQTVTITNTGNQPVTLTQPTAANYVIGTLSATTLEPNATATFTVQPKADLAPGNYDENILITGSSTASASVATSFTVRERPYIPPTPPSVSEETIDAINDAEPGETVSVALKDGDTTLDAEVFETLAGQDIMLEIALEGGVSWTVNGQDIPADANLDDLELGVEMNSDGIPVDVVNSITGERDTVQMTLAHDGDFDFTMTLTAPLGVENAGYWANLYHYNEVDGRMDFEAAVLIDEDGKAALPMSHASQYAIVIDDHSHAIIDLPFSDVSADDWFYDPVVWIYNESLMTGTSATMFEPNTSTTRAMIVSMLARMENVTSAADAGFTDVAAGDWYATAVNWAAANGIVSGISDDTFAPNDPITREQLAAMLMNYAQWKGQDISARADLSDYTDAPSTWASEAVQWAVAEGLLAGVTDDQLQPQGQATRAQVAAIMQRFLEA